MHVYVSCKFCFLRKLFRSSKLYSLGLKHLRIFDNIKTRQRVLCNTVKVLSLITSSFNEMILFSLRKGGFYENGFLAIF